MDELQSWVDSAPDHRAYVLERQPGSPSKYRVEVIELIDQTVAKGVGEGLSITFAAVRAFDDLSAKMSEAE